MYINLGNINLNKTESGELNDWIILSEVIDSSMSYEKPTCIRSIEELEIWFGKDYDSYSYFCELLSSGVTLYLYKPVSTDDCNIGSYVDYENFLDYTYIDLYLDDIKILESLKNNVDSIILVNSESNDSYFYYYFDKSSDSFKKIEDQSAVIESNVVNQELFIGESRLPDLEKVICSKSNVCKFSIINDSGTYIWNKIEEDEYYKFTNVLELPQNTDRQTSSLNNRDTVFILGNKGPINSISPKFDYNTTGFCKYGDILEVNLNTNFLKFIDEDKLEKDEQTFAFRIRHSYYCDEEIDIEHGYVIAPSLNSIREEDGELIYDSTLFVFNNDTSWNTIDNKYYKDVVHVKRMSEFIKGLESIGYLTQLVDTKDNVSTTIVYSNTIIPVRKFFNLENLSLLVEPLSQVSKQILSNFLISESNIESGIRMWSKTIGTLSETSNEGRIKVNVESLDKKGSYRLTISRGNYNEVFEGSLVSKFGEERLDYTVSRESKLVYCEAGDNIDFDSNLDGIYVLSGAIKEASNPSMFINSLSYIFDNTRQVYIDFFLVPDKYKYIDINNLKKDTNYFEIYDIFLKYAKKNSCQFLIENLKTSTKVIKVDGVPELDVKTADPNVYYYDNISGLYSGIVNNEHKFIINKVKISIIENKGDFIYNLVNDRENWLIYFYGSMMTKGEIERPGYYLFLKGILYNTFGKSEKEIMYSSGINDSEPYQKQSIEDVYEKYKSNFLTNNNHIFYYKKYFNGEDYTTTIWMRFVISKIFRELEKNKWRLISTNYVGKTKDILQSIINDIKESFSIVDNINIIKFNPSQNKNILYIGIETRVNDLVSNNISLDITINYSTF
jgi:hypothetical protein